ncbi:hypothetical protein X975_26710, partial [Stegodyphus mimosarum]
MLMTTESSSVTSNLTSVNLPPTTTPDPYTCKKVVRRRIIWPETAIGEVSTQPCPGRSVGWSPANFKNFNIFRNK